MRRLDRYVMGEILGPLTLGFVVYTFILLMQFLFKSAEMIIRRGLPATEVGKLLVYTLPNIVVLTIPMALLFAILVAVGRLASDSELVALRSCGISLFQLYRPVLMLSLLLTLLTGFLMIYLLPRGNSALQSLEVDLLTRSVTEQVQPRVFYDDWQGLMLYVFDQPPGSKRWHGVFLAETNPGSESQVTVADSGQVRVDRNGERLLLDLDDAVTHKVDFHDPDKYEISRHRHLERVLEDRFSSSERARAKASKGVRELTLSELYAKARNSTTPDEIRNLAWVEIEKKFAIPAACLVFGLFALPLGFNNRRGGKSSGFAISILVILAYYVLLNNGEEAAQVGRMSPWLAMWLPNIILTSFGLFLMARRNRDKSLLLSHVDHFVRHTLWQGLEHVRLIHHERRERRRTAAGRRSPHVVLRLPRPQVSFPNLLDRYILRRFAWVLLMVSMSAVLLYIVADLSQNMDDILKNHVALSIVAAYYKYLSFDIFYQIAPIIVLVSTLITFALLSHSNEITVAKALGVSLYRFAFPVVIGALLISLLSVFLQAQVLPASNRKVNELADVLKGRPPAQSYGPGGRQWLFGQGRYIYNYLSYDPQTKTLQRLQVFEFDSHSHLVRRLFTRRAQYVGGAWVFDGGWARSFDGLEVVSYTPFQGPRIVDYPEKPSFFEAEQRQPDQMSYGELHSYIRELRRSGEADPTLVVDLYNKIAFPLISLVMALVALPFAFRLGRRGALYGIGVGVVLGMIFLAVYAFFSTLGTTGALPPIVAVWSPNVIFALLSLYLFLGLRT